MKIRIVLGALVIAAGAIGFIVFLLSRLDGFSTSLQRLNAPGEMVLILEPGTHTVYWEPSGLFQSFPDLICTVASKTSRTPCELSSTWFTRKYSIDGRRGVSEYTFDVPAQGVYVFAARYPVGKTGPGATLAVGPGGGFGMLVTVFGCIAILGGSIASGVGLIISGVKRGKA